MNDLEPNDRILNRIEATVELLSTVEACPHCRSRVVVEALSEGGALPRAISVAHEPECPVSIAFEAAPAVEGAFGV